MTIFELYTVVVGFTALATYSKVALVVRQYMDLDHIEFLQCPQCVGFWVGLFVGLSSGRGWQSLLMACGVSLLSRVTASLLAFLEDNV